MKNFGNRIPSLEELDMFYNPYPGINLGKSKLNQLDIDLILTSLPGVGEVEGGLKETLQLAPYLYSGSVESLEQEQEAKCRYIITSFVNNTTQRAVSVMGERTVRVEDYLEHKTSSLSKAEIVDHINRHGWDSLCRNYILEEKFIEEWVEFMDIKDIIKNQVLSIDFLYSFRSEIKAENMPSILEDQEWYMFIKFMIIKSKEGGVYELHVNRGFFNEFRNKYHAQQFKEISFELAHSNEELVRLEGSFNGNIKVFSYIDIPHNKILCSTKGKDWRNCSIKKTIPMRENETLWELDLDINIDNLEYFTIFE